MPEVPSQDTASATLQRRIPEHQTHAVLAAWCSYNMTDLKKAMQQAWFEFLICVVTLILHEAYGDSQ